MTIDTALEKIEDGKKIKIVEPVINTPNYLLPKVALTDSYCTFYDLKHKYFEQFVNKKNRVQRSKLLEDIEEFQPYEKFCNDSIQYLRNISIEFDRWVPIFDGCINSNIMNDAGTNTKLIRHELKDCVVNTIDASFRYICKSAESVKPVGKSKDWFERRIENINSMYKGFYETDLLIDNILLGKGIHNYVNSVIKTFDGAGRLISWNKLKKATKKNKKWINFSVREKRIDII